MLVSYHTIQQTLRYLLSGFENGGPHKNVLMHTHCTFTHSHKKTENNRGMPKWANGLTSCVHSFNGILVSYKKEMSYQNKKRHGLILNAYYEVKEASLKRLHTVWFQLYNILGKTQLYRW